jgi:hypothetical protein
MTGLRASLRGLRNETKIPNKGRPAMTYICVKCQQTWVMNEPTDYVSGGICRECITAYVHSKQVKAGNEACFGELDECNELENCKYSQWCIT